MPKKNQFSGLSEPDKDVYISSSADNVKRFRKASLKLDRIHNADNEADLTENIIQLCIKYNKAKLDIAWDLDYEDAMATLEEVYNDVDANMMIKAIEMLASQYGYTEEMDIEVVDIEQKMFWFTKETFPALMTRIQTEFARLTGRAREKLVNKIAGGMRSHELESIARQNVNRGEIWKIETPYGVGSETTGFRWAIIISNQKHAQGSWTVNVIYLYGEEVKNKLSHLALTDNDLEDGSLIKPKSRVNLTDIYTIDKKRLDSYKGKVKDEYMEKLMDRIAKQLGMKDFEPADFGEEETSDDE